MSSQRSAARYDALLQLLRAANALWDASRVFFEQWNLSPSQFNVLNLLDSCPRGLSQTELGRQLLTHRSNVTGLVDRLEKRGLVRRNEVSADRRVYHVALTAKGAVLLKSILPHYHNEADLIWDGIAEEHISSLLAALDRVTQNAGEAAVRVPRKSRSKPL